MSRLQAIRRLVSLMVLIAATAATAAETASGEQLYREARLQEQGANYRVAQDLYRQARPLLLGGGREELAEACRHANLRMEKILLTYPYTEADVRRLIGEKYEGTPEERIDEVLADGRLPVLQMDGATCYFEDFLNTLYHVYPDFRTREEAGSLGQVAKLFEMMSPYLYEDADLPPGRTLSTPLRYEAEGEVTLPRDTLPETGLLRVWMPLPLVTPAQPEVEILELYPEQYIRMPLRLEGDLGMAYLEVPLEEVKEDLKIGIRFRMTHHEERFLVDPSRIDPYDESSPLYRRYTASVGNILVTDRIRETARRLAGGETNPYRVARRFYDHIVWDLEYSFTPHAALDAMDIPESVFVHEHGYGDCGAQSMYFAALCRAVGIPARAPGGMQLFPNPRTGCGDHFWAQIYLPGYGWMPVDTSVGQLAKYMPGITDQQKQDFVDYFFGNMDPFRYLIQTDVDIPLEPAPGEPLTFPTVLQAPTAVCREAEGFPGLEFMERWQIKFRQVPPEE